MLAFVGTALAFTLPPLVARAPLAPHRAAAPASMGLFDGLKKAFDNVDYSDSPATYEQTNARASHILVDEEAQIVSIKAQLDAGELDFSEAAVKFSTCKTAERGGKLGKFTPGTMVPEIDEIVFSVEDTGQINLGNGADIYKAKYEVGEVHGPVKSKLGYHLVKIEKRVIADFDFRAKEGALPKANVWDDLKKD
uniref:Peptidyl-prolyl cis-trans isomerase n=1 Tax=Prymnesium polylepis TaxID=72548 RepID=A0A7S4MVF7_9EUKA